jgi:hypothetical protein
VTTCCEKLCSTKRIYVPDKTGLSSAANSVHGLSGFLVRSLRCAVPSSCELYQKCRTVSCDARNRGTHLNSL